MTSYWPRISREQTAWHVAADKGNTEMLQKLWERAEENLRQEELNSKLLLAQDTLGQTVCHRAARWGNIGVLEKVLEWGKEKLTEVELNSLLTKDHMGRTAWHEAAELGNMAVFEKLCELARGGKINLKNERFLAHNKDGRKVLDFLKGK